MAYMTAAWGFIAGGGASNYWPGSDHVSLGRSDVHE